MNTENRDPSMEAEEAYEGGNHRLAATKYLQAFQTSPDLWDVNRWELLCNYVAILEAEHFDATHEDDMCPLFDIMNNENELKLYRIVANYAASMLLGIRGHRELTTDFYRAAIRLAAEVPTREKRHNVWGAMKGTDCSILQPLEGLTTPIIELCSRNLEKMERGLFDQWSVCSLSQAEALLRPAGTPIAGMRLTVGAPMGEGLAFTEEQRDQLLKVGGAACDCCGKPRPFQGLLDVCSRCQKAYYCSKECQVKQWRAGHKQWCRKPGEFKAGDTVKLLLSLEYMILVEVLKEDPTCVGRWEVTLPGQTVCLWKVLSKDMKHIHPWK